MHTAWYCDVLKSYSLYLYNLIIFLFFCTKHMSLEIIICFICIRKLEQQNVCSCQKYKKKQILFKVVKRSCTRREGKCQRKEVESKISKDFENRCWSYWILLITHEDNLLLWVMAQNNAGVLNAGWNCSSLSQADLYPSNYR